MVRWWKGATGINFWLYTQAYKIGSHSFFIELYTSTQNVASFLMLLRTTEANYTPSSSTVTPSIPCNQYKAPLLSSRFQPSNRVPPVQQEFRLHMAALLARCQAHYKSGPLHPKHACSIIRRLRAFLWAQKSTLQPVGGKAFTEQVATRILVAA